MMGPGFGYAVGAMVVRALLIGGICILGVGAGCGFLLARMAR